MKNALPLVSAVLLILLVANAHQGHTNSAQLENAHAFPPPDFVLKDVLHQEPKSGVQLSPGGQLTIKAGVGTPSVINVLAFSANGEFLAAGKDFGRVVLWKLSEKKFFRAIETGQGVVGAVSISPDGKTIATGGNGEQSGVKVWDVDTGGLLWTFKESSDPAVRIEFDREGKWLLVEDNASHVYVIGVADHRLALALPDVRVVVIFREGGSFMTADGKEFSIWTGPSWLKARSIPMWNRYSLLLAAAPAADRFAVYESRTVRIVELTTGDPIVDRSDLVAKNFTWRPTFGEFSSDGAILYLSLDDRLRVWDITKNEVCSSPVMYSGAGALSADNQWFAGAKDDSILSKERTDGVWVWNAKKLLSDCGLSSPARHESK